MDISVKDHVLTLKGERKEENITKNKNYYRSERRFGNFQRSLALPKDVDVDQIKAHYQDCVLELTLPKSEKAKPKEIKVELKNI